ncbi:MAG: PilZ domain-containing protein [Alphaproteobacteria bacterium]|nr:PilZ domain-containing protein [Alphaproteobacteria bacterium]
MTDQRTAPRAFGRRQSMPKPLYSANTATVIARAPRKDVRLPAAITAEHLHGSMSCAVANISSSGALLRLPTDLSASNIHLPENVRLTLIHDRCQVACRVVYQDGLKVAVSFLAPFSPLQRA